MRDSEPCGVRRVFDLFAVTAAMALQQLTSTRRVNHPAGTDAALTVWSNDLDLMVGSLGPQLDVDDLVSVEEFDSCFDTAFAEFILQAPTVQLVGAQWRKYRAAELNSLDYVRVVVVTEEHPQSELPDLLRFEMIVKGPRMSRR